MIFLLSLVPAAAFSPWARNDSTAYVFKSHVDGVLEKRRRKLDALRRKGGDALIRDAVGRGLHWNALGVAFPRDSRDEAFVKFAQTVVAHQPVDRAMLRHDTLAGRRLQWLTTTPCVQRGGASRRSTRTMVRPVTMRNSRRRLALATLAAWPTAALVEDWGLSFENVTRISLKAHAALGREARRGSRT